MTAPDAPPCYTVTRESMGDALAMHPLTEHLTPERRGRMADALLGMAGVPAVANATLYMDGVKAERERIAELALEHASSIRRGSLHTIGAEALENFAALIRKQP